MKHITYIPELKPRSCGGCIFNTWNTGMSGRCLVRKPMEVLKSCREGFIFTIKGDLNATTGSE